MSRPDDFSVEIKTRLSDRAGHRCCFLGCGAPTVGPSQETENSVSRIGMACHISAASSGKGSKRYRPSMTSEERSGYGNGIWMCYSHGKLIDTDQTRFSIDILKRWKEIGENVAGIMLEKGCDYLTAIKLAHAQGFTGNELLITEVGGAENQIIGTAIEDSGVPILWGRSLANAIRSFFIERARNAFQHGAATRVSLKIFPNKVVLTDDGSEFSAKELLSSSSTSGGVLSARSLVEDFGEGVIIADSYEGGVNITTVARIVDVSSISDVTSCYYQITHSDFRRGGVTVLVEERCKEVFVVLPEFITLSDFGLMLESFPALRQEKRPLVFIGRNLAPREVQLIKEHYPLARLIEL